MSMRGAVAGCMVLACLVVLLAETTEGHITFFSPKEMKLFQVAAKGKKTFQYSLLKNQEQGRKDMEPRSEDEALEEPNMEQLPHVADGNPGNNLDIKIIVSPEQQDHGALVREEISHDLAEARHKAK